MALCFLNIFNGLMRRSYFIMQKLCDFLMRQGAAFYPICVISKFNHESFNIFFPDFRRKVGELFFEALFYLVKLRMPFFFSDFIRKFFFYFFYTFWDFFAKISFFFLNPALHLYRVLKIVEFAATQFSFSYGDHNFTYPYLYIK